jgi:hypothetical protein
MKKMMAGWTAAALMLGSGLLSIKLCLRGES